MASIPPLAPSGSGNAIDSQDSGITPGAVQPLPDSQESGSFELQPSSAMVNESVAQLRHGGFTRLDDSLDTEDLAEGFTFGKPVLVEPPAFTRRPVGPFHEPQSPDNHSTQAVPAMADATRQVQMDPKAHSTPPSHIGSAGLPKPVISKPDRATPSAHTKAPFPELPTESSLHTSHTPVDGSLFKEPINRPSAPAPREQRSAQSTSLTTTKQAPANRNSPIVNRSMEIVSDRNGNEFFGNRDNERGAPIKQGTRPSRTEIYPPHGGQHKHSRHKLVPRGSSPRSAKGRRQRGRRHDREQNVNRPIRQRDISESLASPVHRQPSSVYTPNTSRKATPSQIRRNITQQTPSATRCEILSLANPSADSLSDFQENAELLSRENPQEDPQPNLQFRTETNLLNAVNNLLAEKNDKAQKAKRREGELQAILQDRDRLIKQHNADMRAQKQQIMQLSEERDSLQKEAAEKVLEYERLSARHQQLDEKARKYRDHANKAVAEQQSLHKTMKETYQNTIEQSRLEHSKAKALAEQQKAKAEAALEDVRQRVAYATSEAKRLQLEFQEKMNELGQQLKDRDDDLARERSMVDRLNERLSEQGTCQEVLQVLQGETSAISQKMAEWELREREAEASAREGQAALLAPITERLNHITEEIKTQPAGWSDWVKDTNETTSKILAKLEELASAQSQTSTSAAELSQKLDTRMQEIWSCLEENGIALSQDLQDKKYENALLTTIMEEKDDQLRSLSLDWEEVTNRASYGEARIQELEASLVALHSATQGNNVTSEEVEALQEEVRRLTEAHTAQAASTSELEKELRRKEEESATEAKKFKTDTLEFARILQEREDAAETVKQQAVDAAVREATLASENAQQALQTHVDRVESDKHSLAVQLDTVEKAMADLREKDRCDEQKAAEKDETISQNADTISVLEKLLEKKRQADALMVKENEAVDKACKELIDRLKSEAQDTQFAGNLTAQAQSAQEEDSNKGGSNSRFSNLWELLRLIKSFLTLSQASTQSRRVKVQTTPDTSVPTPPSVTQEQQRRREGSKPRGIMRPATATTVVEDTQATERRRLLQKSQIPGSGIFSHGIVSQQTVSAMSDGGEATVTDGKDGPQPGQRKRTRSNSDSSVPKKMARTEAATGGDEAIENAHDNASTRNQTYRSKPGDGSSKTSTQSGPSTRSSRRSKSAIIQDSQEPELVAVN